MSIRTIRCGGGAKPYISPIEWVDLGDLNWTVGDVISIDIKTLSGDNSPVGYTIYTMNAQSTPLPAGITFSTNGLLAGTVLEYQGGTYAFIFDATRPDITITSFITVTYVALPPVAPSLTDPADVETGVLEEGSYYQFQLVSTNPESNTLSYTLDIAGGSDSFDTITVDSAGRVIFRVAAAQQNTYNLIYKVTDTVTLLTDTASHSVVIDAVSGNAETPQLGGFYSGALYCEVAGVAPTWHSTIPDFNLVVGQDLTLDLNDYVTTDSAITEFLTDSGTVPSGIVLVETGTGLGTFTGVTDTEAVYTPAFTAENATGVSAASNAPTMTVSASTAPTIDFITADLGTNTVYVHCSEPVYAGDLDYVIGHLWEVNPVTPAEYRTPTYVSGASTSTLVFTLDGLVFTGNNTIRFAFDGDVSDLRSIAADVQVPDATPADYVVPPPVTEGVFMFDDFRNATVGDQPYQTNPVINTDGARWRVGREVWISNAKSLTYGKSIAFTYPAENANGYSYSELPYTFGSGYHKEVWFRIKLFIPANYYHHADDGSGGNNKGPLILQGENSTLGPSHVEEMWPNDNGVNRQRVICWSKSAPSGDETMAQYLDRDWFYDPDIAPTPQSGGFIRQQDRGTWIDYISHIKEETALDAGDGIHQTWVIDSDNVRRSLIDAQNVPNFHWQSLGYNKGYILGWANAGFHEPTTFYADSITFSTESLL